ncbi:MAG: hypothetical protein AB7U47_00880 [Variibacter sp.]
MTRRADLCAALARMEAARRSTRHHLAVIERQIANRAERMTNTARAKRCHRRRSAGAWTGADERAYQGYVADLILARLPEIDALTRKLARQDDALAALRSRYGVGANSAIVER